MPDDLPLAEPPTPMTGRLLTLPTGPFFHLQRAEKSTYRIGEFRAWAGYKNLGTDVATHDLAHFQHVLSFAATEQAGRTGVHAHLAHAHIVIPTSGQGTFSYDGVITVAVLGMVIVQHGGTVHDQFNYSYAAASDEENRRTPLAVEGPAAGTPLRSFGFLELFVPRAFANVEIVPPGAVTPTDQATAWDHPYHAPGHFALQREEAPDAAYRPVAGHDDLEARDAGTWDASDRLVATWILRPVATGSTSAALTPMTLGIVGESGGIEIFYMVSGSGRFRPAGGAEVWLHAGDTSTHSQGELEGPFEVSPDFRLLRFFIAARAQLLRERTPAEIARIEALGPAIIRGREIRPPNDTRPVNALRDAAAQP